MKERKNMTQFNFEEKDERLKQTQKKYAALDKEFPDKLKDEAVEYPMTREIYQYGMCIIKTNSK